MNKTTIAIVIAVVVIAWFVVRPNMPRAAQSNPPERVAENLEGEADPSRMTLGMTTWKWITATEGGKEIKPLKVDAFTVKFNDDKTFTVTTDCNHMGGGYSADKANITFSDMFSTKMFCEGSQEMVFSSLLTDARTYRFTSRGELILTTKSGGTVTFR
jgi:heat shock protein HslJ